jgi:hypothetical protein
VTNDSGLRQVYTNAGFARQTAPLALNLSWSYNPGIQTAGALPLRFSDGGGTNERARLQHQQCNTGLRVAVRLEQAA